MGRTTDYKEAILYESYADKSTSCLLCAHKCNIHIGKKGFCQERVNIDGALYSLNYGRLIAAHVDPIEKKPLHHFLPGSQIFSIAAPGCNLRCKWCQNWDISQASPHNDPSNLRFTPASEIVSRALSANCKAIAYTYTEPTVFFEYTLDVSKLAREAGLKNVYVTNGYMSDQMLDVYLPYLDAANVDIKAFDDQVYLRFTGAHLEPVLESCKRMKKAGVWLEITTLLIPGLNDDEIQLKGLADFIVTELGSDTPWHISRYFPQPQFSEIDATPVSSIRRAIEIGREAGLHYIYAGNVQGAAVTYCPKCGHELIVREGYYVSVDPAFEGVCPKCQTKIAGVWASD